MLRTVFARLSHNPFFFRAIIRLRYRTHLHASSRASTHVLPAPTFPVDTANVSAKETALLFAMKCVRITSSVPATLFGRMARQRLGQHFLADAQWREQIARAIRVSPHSTAPASPPGDSCWIEIGAGHGEMTEHLLSTGVPVFAVELDPPLIAGLRRIAKKSSRLTVVPGDILETDIAAIAAGRRVRIYGNLPFYITSPILHHLFNFADIIDEMHFVIQTEVALRLAAEPGTKSYGYLSVATQLYTRPEFVFEIPRAAFRPPPKVTSALVTMRLPGERTDFAPHSETRSPSGQHAHPPLVVESHFLNFVKLCFSQKRKTLVNNLRSLAEPNFVREALSSLSLRSDARAEQLTVSQLATLYRILIPG
jgi:16S rRNA (adenine1518-N6/adenine1519-N6)-dimethyltransferase